MATNDYNPQSSGRWDAAGSFDVAVEQQRYMASKWARSLDINALIHHVEIMLDNNALTLYERKALLEVVLDHLHLERTSNHKKG